MKPANFYVVYFALAFDSVHNRPPQLGLQDNHAPEISIASAGQAKLDATETKPIKSRFSDLVARGTSVAGENLPDDGDGSLKEESIPLEDGETARDVGTASLKIETSEETASWPVPSSLSYQSASNGTNTTCSTGERGTRKYELSVEGKFPTTSNKPEIISSGAKLTDEIFNSQVKPNIVQDATGPQPQESTVFADFMNTSSNNTTSLLNSTFTTMNPRVHDLLQAVTEVERPARQPSSSGLRTRPVVILPESKPVVQLSGSDQIPKIYPVMLLPREFVKLVPSRTVEIFNPPVVSTPNLKQVPLKSNTIFSGSVPAVKSGSPSQSSSTSIRGIPNPNPPSDGSFRSRSKSPNSISLNGPSAPILPNSVTSTNASVVWLVPHGESGITSRFPLTSPSNAPPALSPVSSLKATMTSVPPNAPSIPSPVAATSKIDNVKVILPDQFDFPDSSSSKTIGGQAKPSVFLTLLLGWIFFFKLF